MDVPTNRAVIGFDSETPLGKWYDSEYTPKLTIYTHNYDLWDNPETSTIMALKNLKDSEKVF
ncbi:MAG: hypothetical protein LBF85_11605, partial [Tannerella sp.]|nr:hypothetical protein [Tannerella sp.]